MDILFLKNYFRKHLSLASFLLLLSLLVLPACTSIYARMVPKAKRICTITKKQEDPRLFLILVVDTDDKDIGERCETDREQVSDEFTDIATGLGASLEKKTIKGSGFSKAAVTDVVENWLPSQNLQSTDIIVFYYSGHGFRYPGDVSDYPRMWLKTADNKDIAKNNLQLETDVYDHIIKLGAGVNIVLSDCCNSTVADATANFDNVMVPARAHVTHKPIPPGDSSSETENDEKLFMPQHPLSVLVAAASKGELAGGKADTGGFFTGYLLDALDSCIYDETMAPDWQTLFNYADEKASYWAKSALCPAARHNEQGRCVQTVVFKTN